MMCKICNSKNEALIESVNTMLEEAVPPKEIALKIKEEFGEAFTPIQVAAHGKHAQEEAEKSSYTPFYLKDGKLYKQDNDELVEFIDPRLGLRIIATIGIGLILKSGGYRLSARYTVEVLKILSELVQDDSLATQLTDTWSTALKEKPAVVAIVENPIEQTTQYMKEQEARRLDFEEKIGLNKS